MPSAAVPHHAAADDDAPSVAVLWLIAIAGCMAAVAVAAITYATYEGDVPFVEAAIVAWITLAYLLCGLVAWSRRPESAFGPLLIAVSFGPLLSRLSDLDAPALEAIGEVCLLLPAVMFVHVFLAYPSGRLERRFERRLMAGAYATTLGFGVISAASTRLERSTLAEASLMAQRVGTTVFVLAALAVLIARMRHGGTQAGLRRLFALTLVGVATGIVMTASGAPGTQVIRLVAFGLIGVAPVFLLAGHLRARLARAAVGDLFVELRSDPAPLELRDAVARALRDESVELVYWLDDFGTYADHNGRAVVLPEWGGERSVALIERDGAAVAALLHDPALDDERELLDAVTAAAGIAVENGRLHAELQARLEELRGSRARILDAGQKERQRLERNLHDGAQQRLVALSLDLRLLEERLEDDPETKLRLDRARREIATSLEELRDVARGIHPAVVSGHGLEIALEQLVARAPVPVRLSVDLHGRLPERLEVAAFYLVSESLANIAKHSEASSASVAVARRGAEVVVEVVDDGIGGADTERGSGLRGLADRVEALGGRVRVWSPRGGGTRLRAEIPCAP